MAGILQEPRYPESNRRGPGGEIDMPQHLWTVPCRFSIVAQQSNNVSLIEVLEEIAIPTVLPQQPDMALIPAIFDVVTLWSRDDEEQRETSFGRMSLLSPTGETV